MSDWEARARAHMKGARKMCKDMPEADCDANCTGGDDGCWAQRRALAAALAGIAADEREACAKIAEHWGDDAGRVLAAHIRARGSLSP